MKKIFSCAVIIFAFTFTCVAQNKEAESRRSIVVPAAVKSALAQKYPEAKKVTWEKEKGNYEANWGGKSGEDNSVQFTPAGVFIEIVQAIPVKDLPKAIPAYVAAHYKGAKITEAANVTDAAGKKSYEAEVKGHDLIFDLDGNYLKND